MAKKEIVNLTDYLTKPLSLEQQEHLNKENDIIIEYIDLFIDFMTSLTTIINKTYLNEDIINSEYYIIKHFNWCWEKNIKNFEKENIGINSQGEHYEFAYNYFYENFYIETNKSKKYYKEIISYWEDVFAIHKIKTKVEYDFLIFIYNVLKDNFAFNLVN